MIKFNILKLLNDKGKTKYRLNKQLGMSYGNFIKMGEHMGSPLHDES